MFPWRILRETDHLRLLARIEYLERQDDQRLDRIHGLQERLIDAEASKRSAMTMRDGLVTRVNQLEQESAVLRNRITGLPQVAPKIEVGQPLRTPDLAGGIDFDDVGDDKARSLGAAGLLHDDQASTGAFPDADTLTKHLQ